MVSKVRFPIGKADLSDDHDADRTKHIVSPPNISSASGTAQRIRSRRREGGVVNLRERPGAALSRARLLATARLAAISGDGHLGHCVGPNSQKPHPSHRPHQHQYSFH